MSKDRTMSEHAFGKNLTPAIKILSSTVVPITCIVVTLPIFVMVVEMVVVVVVVAGLVVVESKQKRCGSSLSLFWVTQLLPSHVGTYHYFLHTKLAYMAEQQSTYFIVVEKVECSNSQKGRCFFAPHKIKLALVRVHQEAIRRPSGLYVESCNSPHPGGLLMESIRSIPGV